MDKSDIDLQKMQRTGENLNSCKPNRRRNNEYFRSCNSIGMQEGAIVRDKKSILAHPKVWLLMDGDDGMTCQVDWKKQTMMLRIIASWGCGWDHVSVSRPHLCPTWEMMCFVKDIFFKPEEMAIQYHPAKSDYINCHEYCLHLWRPHGLEIPTPPKIMV